MDTASKRAQDFQETPEDEARRWAMEIGNAREVLRPWHEQAERIHAFYLDERQDAPEGEKRVNLFTANVQTQEALLYGQAPRASVNRRFGDPADDDARLAGLLLERVLNAELDPDGDTYSEALGHVLQDRLIGGMGQARVRYEVELELVGEVVEGGPPPEERKASESAPTDYVYWRDFLWSPARVWSQVRWVAFRNEMTAEQVEERWGEEVSRDIPYGVGQSQEKEEDAPNPWQRAEVWEIWDSTRKLVFWWVPSYDKVLEQKADPYELKRFFPCGMPFFANPTTGKVVPRPDFTLSEDQYRDINELTTRIALLVKAVRAAGAYDSSNEALKNLLDGDTRNRLYPVQNWAGFSEKGGLRGGFELMPLEVIVSAIQTLRIEKEAAKAELYEVTGMSDLLRGQAAQAGASATEQAIKSRFASVRVQRLQQGFANFATALLGIKAEVICRFFDAATILRLANAEQMEDAKRPGAMDAAVALLKSRFHEYRVEVKAESLSMADFASLRQESMEVLQGIAAFMQALTPMAQAIPGSMPYLLRVFQWGMSKIKGGAEVEGVIDEAIKAFEQQQAQAAANPQQAPPDPKLLVEQARAAADEKKVQNELQADIIRTREESQAKMQQESHQTRENVTEALQKAEIQRAMHPPAPVQPGGVS
jgi:hypothetical protein